MDGTMMQNIILCVLISTLVSIIVDLIADVVRARRITANQSNVTRLTPISVNRSSASLPPRPQVVPRSTYPPALPTGTGSASVAQRSSIRPAERAMPRSLPSQAGVGQGNPNGFPRCPIHRCCNRPHEPQMIFWDSGRAMWRCHRGHYFQS